MMKGIPYDIFYIIDKEFLARSLFRVGIALAFFGSLNPWFLWPLGSYYIVPAVGFLMAAYIVSLTMKSPIFTSKYYLLGTFAYTTLIFYMSFVNNGSFMGYIANLFNVFIFYAFFKMERQEMPRLMTFFCKTMAVICGVSMVGFVMYLAGFSLPGKSVQFSDGLYTYTNYYFFLLDDRFVMTIVPRFHAVFLEPGQMGTATVLLLQTQIGKWKKWYNVILMIATLISFSLAAYVLLVVIIFLHLWIKRRNFIGKLIGVTLFIATIVAGSFFYNDGDNLLNQLIVMRMEVNDDGELEGDNRVREDFEAEFQSYLTSSDIFLGRDMPPNSFGNSGYRVYIYEYGVFGVLLLIVFYMFTLSPAHNKRCQASAWLMAFLMFIVRAFPLWPVFFFPVYAIAIEERDNNPESSTSPIQS